MEHKEFKEKLLKGMGGQVPIGARPAWGEFLKKEGTEFRLLYDWIKMDAFFKWIWECEDVDFGEGGEAVTVWICRHGRVGHDK